MRTSLLSLLAAGLLAAAAAPASGATACGALHGGFEHTITATGVSCTTARDLVRRWHRRAVTQGQGPGTKYVGSWYCASRPTDPEHVRVSCARGTRKVRFSAGP